jgi:hypothetical protein
MELEILERNLKKLPIEVINTHIIPYTYKFQSKELMNDIQSLYKVKEYLKEVYYERWKNTFEYEENADLNWLDNDIMRFFHEDQATIYGYKNNCIRKYKRLYILQKRQLETTIKYISKRRKANQNINIQLGLLIPNERNRLIDFALNLENE